MRRTLVTLISAILGVARLGAQDSVACKDARNGPTNFLGDGVGPWRKGADGVERMSLVGRPDASATEVVVYRERYPGTYLGDSAKATVHRNVGTAYILVLKGTLVVGYGPQVDFGKAAAYGPDSFIAINTGDPYYVWSRGPVEIQVEAMGQPRTGPVLRVHGRDQPVPPTLPPAIARTASTEWSSAPANGLGKWESKASVGTMSLVESHPTSPTELRPIRMYFLPPLLQDSTKPLYHFHFGTEHITILCGTIVYGEGDHVDLKKAKEYGPGSFIENPAGNPHFEYFRGPVEAEVDMVGPSSAVPLDPLTGKPLP